MEPEMKFCARVLNTFGAILVLIACTTGAGHAADLSQPVTLVATSRLAGSIYDETVLVAAPLPQGHVGFILNRPTRVKLENLFPGHAPSRKVVEPVSLGGPMLPGMIVALTRKAPLNAAAAIPLMSGLVAVIDSESVDRVIETTPNNARYFAGLVIWAPGELDQEIRDGAWNVRPASAEIVFSANPAGLWKELGGGVRWIQVRLER
jgi:putative transcriptional regulator